MPVIVPHPPHLCDAGHVLTGEPAAAPSRLPTRNARGRPCRVRPSDSRLARAAAHASGLAVYVCPWKKVRSLSGVPRKASYTSSVAKHGRQREVAGGQAPLPQVSRSGDDTGLLHAPTWSPVRPNPVATSSAISNAPARLREVACTAHEICVVREHAGSRLDHRFDNHRADLVAAGAPARIPVSFSSEVGGAHPVGRRNLPCVAAGSERYAA